MKIGRAGGFKGGRKYQGGWIEAAISAIGAIGSLAGMFGANRNAERAARAEQALRSRQLRLAEAENSRAQRLFDEYQQTYLPREREFVEAAFSDEMSPEAAAARATTDVRAASEARREMSLRDARRLGINPTSGAYAAMENDRALRDTALEVTARDQARRNARAENFQRQHAALSLGSNLPATTAAFSGNAAGIIGRLADAASFRTDQANELAGAAGDAFGRALNNLALSSADLFSRPASSYSVAHGPAEQIRLSDAGTIMVRRPVLYEDKG